MKQFHHPCIPMIYDIEEEEQSLCIIEEYIPGTSLFSYCLKQNLREMEILSFMIQLCDLLEYLHCREEPVLHLDLKPENLKVHEGKLYVLDFGSAVQKTRLEEKGALSGTPGYCAPECYQGKAAECSDIYSAGKILSFLMEHAISAKKMGKWRIWNRQRRKERLWKALKRVVKKATRERMNERYQSALAMKKALCAWKEEEKEKSLEAVSIAVMGCGRRSGATYVSLLLAGYFRSLGKQVLYLECNESGSISGLLAADEKQGEIVDYHGIKLAESRFVYDFPCHMAAGWLEEERSWQQMGFSVVIRDYGCLTKERLTYLEQADYRLLVTGCNDWELENAWRALCLWKKAAKKPVQLLLNFGNRKNAAVFFKRLSGVTCYALPLLFAEPDKLPEEWEDVFWEVFAKERDGKKAKERNRDHWGIRAAPVCGSDPYDHAVSRVSEPPEEKKDRRTGAVWKM